MKQESSYTRGVFAEDKVREYFISKGYKIVETRYKTKFGEIDLIIKNNEYIVAVEVKARKYKDDYILGEISERQKSRICKAMMVFISDDEGCNECSIRFDAVFVSGHEKIIHIENAWYGNEY